VNQPRSRKMYVLWAIALTLLLSTGLFSWLVVVPVWQVHSWLTGTVPLGQIREIEAIDKLGGLERAATKLSLYLRFVARSREEKHQICYYLGFCGPSAVPGLVHTLHDKDAVARLYAARALGATGDSRVVEILIAALQDEHKAVRHAAAEGLGWLADDRAIGPLEAMAQDAHADVREAAVFALKTFRARDLDYCLRLGRSAPDCRLKDKGPALIAIARDHVREGMSRSQVTKLLRDMGPRTTDRAIFVTFVAAPTVPSATFVFERDRLVWWRLSYAHRAWYYPGETFRHPEAR
jgi:HEAT repeats